MRFEDTKESRRRRRGEEFSATTPEQVVPMTAPDNFEAARRRPMPAATEWQQHWIDRGWGDSVDRQGSDYVRLMRRFSLFWRMPALLF